MPKYSTLLTLTVAAALLSGCGNAPPSESAAGPAGPTESATATATSTLEPTQSPTPDASSTPTAATSPEPTPSTTANSCILGLPQDPEVTPEYPVRGYDHEPIVMGHGQTLTIAGEDYVAGEEIIVVFGPWQTDADYIQPMTVAAGPNGSYSCQIKIDPAWEPGDYSVLTLTSGDFEKVEASKRYLRVKVISAPASQG